MQNKEKPVVNFVGEPIFFDYDGDPEQPVAKVYVLDHPYFRDQTVRTSIVLKKFEDGSFETMNTVYVPLKEGENNV